MKDEEVSKTNTFQHLYKKLEVPAKTVLIREGEVAKHTYYIESGCVRIWFNHDGKDITLNFFFDGDGVSSIESFRDGVPSPYNVETLEPTTLYSIDKENFNLLKEQSPAYKKRIEEETFKQLFMYEKLFLSLIRDSAETRYKELIINRPEIIKRVPQHYIATYLGINPVSLSRIRNGL